MRDVSRRWGCFGCNIGPLREGTYLTTQEIVDTISQLHAMGCHTLVFRGGDVFIDIKKASAIIQRARQLGFENIFLVTHGIFNSDECFRLLYENEVHPIFQVFPPVKDIYEKITGVTNPLATILLSLGRLKKMGMPFSINLLSEYSIMREMKEAVEFYKALSPSSLLEDVLVSSYMEMQEDGQWDPVKKALLFDKKFAKVSASSFFDRWQFHPCLYGKISINIFGDVSPCPSLYNDVLGNVREKSLPEIFGEEKYQRYWEMSKEKILPCRSCEFRYACDECRGLEKWATGTLTEIKYCSYDLLEGTWTSMPRNRLNNKLEPER
jgi:radical SAM protein with 4Fe4S-binding SPASM domain